MINRFHVFMMAAALALGGAAASAQAHDTKTECEKVGVSTTNENVEQHGTSVSHHYFWRARSPEEREAMQQQRLRRQQENEFCNNKHGTPLFLREDLAYSVTGIDCFGNRPSGYSTENGEAPDSGPRVREPASVQDVSPHEMENGGPFYNPVQ